MKKLNKDPALININPITEISDALAQQIFMLKQQLSADHALSTQNYTRAVDKPQTTVMSAWDGHQLVGLAVLNTAFTLSGAVGDVDDVVVDESYRGQGISKLLLDAIVAEAKSIGLDKLRLTSGAHRIAANSLYRSYGFTLFDTNTYRLDL